MTDQATILAPAVFDDFRQQVASFVKTVQSGAVTNDPNLRQELHGLSHTLSSLADDLRYHSEREDYIIGGLDERRVVEMLPCSWAELRRWRQDGRFPATEGSVGSFEWRSMGRGTRPVIVQGWRAETIEALKPKVEIWREEHKANRKAKKILACVV